MPTADFLRPACAIQHSNGETANHIARGHCVLWVMISAMGFTPDLARHHVRGSSSQANIGPIRTTTNVSVMFW